MPKQTTPSSEASSTQSGTEDDSRLRSRRLNEAVSETLSPDADRSLVAGAVLTHLYYDQPQVRLEDVLELNRLITIDETDGDASSTLDEQVQHVLEKAFARLDEWGVPPASDATPEPELVTSRTCSRSTVNMSSSQHG